MKENLTRKIIKAHLVSGEMKLGAEIAIKVDQTLTQDATGTMSYLQFETLGIPRVKTKLSVSYVDHNMLEMSFENADDHRYLQSVAAKYGVYFSRPGNGICHQVHLERFAVSGGTLLGSDSHTPTCGGLGMLAIGVGGLDVAVAMAGGPFYFKMPKVVSIELKGSLKPWVSAKDVVFELLKRLSVKGGVGKVFEYTGAGVSTLSVPERATITNMGAELGATTSIFPSDERTREFLTAQKRPKAFRKLAADRDASYDETITIDLGKLEPMAACPNSPDNVMRVKEIEGTEIHQVAIGSCTNSSYKDLTIAAKILKGKKVHPNVSLIIAPGSRQVFEMISQSGALSDLIASGARILEAACGPCIGMGQAPQSGGVSLRSFNRNFKGRCGTEDSEVYLASPEVCAASALKGLITDPRVLGRPPKVDGPRSFYIDDGMIIPPPKDGRKVKIIRGPNIAPCPTRGALENDLRGVMLIKCSDNITTDDILPGGAEVLPLRSNIPKISEYLFYKSDSGFYKRALEKQGGFIIGGENYGQGSSREHAALAPMFVGVKAVIAKSFARIHRANLINFGIAPLIFDDPSDYDRIFKDDMLEVGNIKKLMLEGKSRFKSRIVTRDKGFMVKVDLTERERGILIAGGLLNYVKGGKNG